jgi:hypothetical protein
MGTQKVLTILCFFFFENDFMFLTNSFYEIALLSMQRLQITVKLFGNEKDGSFSVLPPSGITLHSVFGQS